MRIIQTMIIFGLIALFTGVALSLIQDQYVMPNEVDQAHKQLIQSADKVLEYKLK